MNVKDLVIPDSKLPAWVQIAGLKWTEFMLHAGRLYHNIFGASRLPMNETVLLLYLAFRPEKHSEPAQLAEVLHISRQTMTGLLVRMEKAHLISSKAPQDDKRRKKIFLEERGIKELKIFANNIFKRDAAFIETHMPKDVESSIDRLENLLVEIEEWICQHPVQA